MNSNNALGDRVCSPGELKGRLEGALQHPTSPGLQLGAQVAPHVALQIVLFLKSRPPVCFAGPARSVVAIYSFLFVSQSTRAVLSLMGTLQSSLARVNDGFSFSPCGRFIRENKIL